MPDFFAKTQSWLLADLIGILMVIPIVFSLIESTEIVITRSKVFEFLLIMFLLGFSGYFIFTDYFKNSFYNILIAYFTTPIYLWLALRFDSKMTTIAGVVSLTYISYLAAHSGNDYLGKFVEKPYVLLQGFSILISVIIFLVHSIFNERQKSLISLQVEEEKYRTLFENMPISLWEDDYSEAKKQIDSWPEEIRNNLMISLKTNKELYKELITKIKIVDMNRSSLDLYEENNKTSLTQKVPDIFSSGDADAFRSVIVSFYEGKTNLEERVMEVKIKRRIHFLSVRWFIMPGHEKDLSRILVTIVNITDLKKAEKDIRLLNHNLEKKVAKRTEDLNRANQELEAFSYSVSHDLKAPLRAIRGFSNLLIDEYGNDIQAGAMHYIKNIEKNSDKMTNLITDLLQFSRLGRKSIEYSSIEMQALVNNTWEDLTSLKNPGQIEFIVNPLPIVFADKSLITQVFVNLLSNAIKYSKQNSPGKIEISCKTDSEYHEFSIQDEGIGFEQKHSEKIFKVFQRLHTQDEYEGSGVGLALVQRIIHRHGGNIHAVSESGKGTNIIFTLPAEIDSELFPHSKKI
jgi:signal transduction histidine kinase